MDFIAGLPMTWRQHDSIMVVVDKLTKAKIFIPVKSTYKTDAIAKIFMKEIFILHGFPKAIVSDKDPKFTSNFWKGLFVDFVDVIVTSECIHLYLLSIVTRCLFREVSIMRKSCQVIMGNPPIGQGLKSPQLWGAWVIRHS